MPEEWTVGRVFLRSGVKVSLHTRWSGCILWGDEVRGVKTKIKFIWYISNIFLDWIFFTIYNMYHILRI